MPGQCRRGRVAGITVGGLQEPVPCRRPPRRVPPGRPCSAARLLGAGPARAAPLCWRPARERLCCRPGTGRACAPHPSLRCLPSWREADRLRNAWCRYKGLASARPAAALAGVPSGSSGRAPGAEVVHSSEGKVTRSGTKVVCSGSQQLRDLVVSLTKSVLRACSDGHHLDKWNVCEI